MSEKDMKDDSSIEGNDANAAIIRLLTKKQTKLSPSSTNG
jgi:hypothetical protein